MQKRERVGKKVNLIIALPTHYVRAETLLSTLAGLLKNVKKRAAVVGARSGEPMILTKDGFISHETQLTMLSTPARARSRIFPRPFSSERTTIATVSRLLRRRGSRMTWKNSNKR